MIELPMDPPPPIGPTLSQPERRHYRGFPREYSHKATVWTVDLESAGVTCRFNLNDYATQHLVLPDEISLESYLRSSARIVAPPERADLFTLTDPYMRRALTSQYFPPTSRPFLRLPDGQKVTYSWSMSKGNGPSGLAYGIHSNKSAHDLGGLNNHTIKSAPLGLFGLEDAQKEITIANALAECGLRVGIPIGIIELDKLKLREALENIWDLDRYSSLKATRKERVDEIRGYMFVQLEKMDQHPCILVRFTGSLGRLSQYGDDFDIPDKEKRDALAMLLSDFGLTDDVKRKVEQDCDYSNDDFIRMLDALENFFLSQKNALQKAVNEIRKLGYDSNASNLLQARDVDYSLITQDFEMLQPPPLATGVDSDYYYSLLIDYIKYHGSRLTNSPSVSLRNQREIAFSNLLSRLRAT